VGPHQENTGGRARRERGVHCKGQTLNEIGKKDFEEENFFSLVVQKYFSSVTEGARSLFSLASLARSLNVWGL
jgi:hypothetical protein